MNETFSKIAERTHVVIHGTVQGVGFRPFVYRLANDLGLKGWVSNTSHGVVIDVDGDRPNLDQFVRRLKDDRPPNSAIAAMDVGFLSPAGYKSFEIRPSATFADNTVRVLPDLATCPACIAEILDPTDRRYRYPFTNCTQCGPRFSIVNGLPYDRANTTMKKFSMCAACEREFENPGDRRFHAQPIACPDCGPQLELWDANGKSISSNENALLYAAKAIEDGEIVAIKGLGGFQLLVDARNEAAVVELRKRKFRSEKPFAVMFPGIDDVAKTCELSNEEKALLNSPSSPIVLLRRNQARDAGAISLSVAPENPYIGVMVPYTPLHALLLRELGFPVVATSGNISEEPICIDELDAVERLRGIADFFLVHDRPIARAMDDSVVKISAGKPFVLRAARGCAPLSVAVDQDLPPLFAVGGHMKNTVAVTAGNTVVIGQHIGDLDSESTYQSFLSAKESLTSLYGAMPVAVARDCHPDYLSSQYADGLGIPSIKVQHHHAHIVSCMAEHGLNGSVLGVSWDGSGYGTDGSLWGGEFLTATRSEFIRSAHFRPFPLPGGEKAAREPRRAALGLLFAMLGDKVFFNTGLAPVRSFVEPELQIIRSMLRRKINSPMTSSVGRLFDAVASLVNLRQRMSFEGQAAMGLEFAAETDISAEPYKFQINVNPDQSLLVDWEPMVLGILGDLAHGEMIGKISSRFHHTLVEIIVSVAGIADQDRVVLSGGCFQNGFLLVRAIERLRDEGFEVYWPHQVPSNDGGLSLGQIIVAAEQLRRKSPCA